MFTPYHSQYLAYRLTLEGIGQDAFARSLSTARVEMKPHQVDAALFALQSPLSKGAILADEVGLGKTIEAGLVIAQRWAEQRRRILLIVPASLRKQWTQELQSKFSVQSEILESKSYRERKKAGHAQPFEVPGKVVVTSYEFAARQADEIATISWDLVVFDEAHRLRNVARKNGSKRAKDLRRAVQSRFKILLTATPLQNTLLELFGLVSVIDDKYFGDEKSFKARYGKGTDPAALAMLRERLQPVSRRMLRKQVHDAGHINYTARHSHTFQFEPDDKEVELYELVSAFLQSKDTVAFGDKPNQLVTLVVRKILGSSTAALVDTLGKILDRLKKRLPVDSSALSDIEIVDEMAEEIDADEEEVETKVDPKKLATEIAVIEGFINLAKSIGVNAKGEKLVRGLPTVLDEIVARKGNRKAVIFTESVRTQHYLHELLSRNGFANDIVLMNGSNDDPESKAIYADWVARHKGGDAISGSKSADMKAAIVEAFRDKRSILIATESRCRGHQPAILLAGGQFRSAMEPAAGGAAYRSLPSLWTEDRRDRREHAQPQEQGRGAGSRTPRTEIQAVQRRVRGQRRGARGHRKGRRFRAQGVGNRPELPDRRGHWRSLCAVGGGASGQHRRRHAGCPQQAPDQPGPGCCPQAPAPRRRD